MLAGYWAGVPALAEQSQDVPAPSGGASPLRPGPAGPAPGALAPVGAGPAPPRRRAAPAPRAGPGRLRRLPPVRPLGGALPWRRADAAAVIACEISALDDLPRGAAAGHGDDPRRAVDPSRGAGPPARHDGLRRPSTAGSFAVKDEEIALADHVLTVSELARQTYLEAGVPPEKVHAVPLGADLELFVPDRAARR